MIHLLFLKVSTLHPFAWKYYNPTALFLKDNRLWGEFVRVYNKPAGRYSINSRLFNLQEAAVLYSKKVFTGWPILIAVALSAFLLVIFAGSAVAQPGWESLPAFAPTG
jgi:hypothetical protein